MEREEAHREFLERSRRDAFDLTRALDQDIVRVAYWRMNLKPTKCIDAHTFLYGDPDDRWRVMRFDPDTELYQEIDRTPGPPPSVEDLEREVEVMEAGLKRFRPTADSFSEEIEALKAFPDRAVRGRGAGINIDYQSLLWMEAIALRPDLVGCSNQIVAGTPPENIEAMNETIERNRWPKRTSELQMRIRDYYAWRPRPKPYRK